MASAGAGLRQAECVRLAVYTNGRGAPERYLQRRIARSSAAAAFAAPRTVGELADELGVAAAYVEDEVRHLVDREVMVKVGGAGALRYQTDFVIASMAVQQEIYRSVEGLVARVGPAVRDALAAAEGDLRAIGFHGASRPWGDLLWTLVPMSFYEAHGRYCKRDGAGSWKEAPERKDGGQWFAVGYEGYEERDRAPFFWKGGNNFEDAKWDGGRAEFYNPGVEGLGLRAGMLDSREIRTVVALVEADAPDQGCVAELVMRGLVERIEVPGQGIRLQPTLLVFTHEQRRRVLEVLEPVLHLYDGMIREAYAFSHAAMASRVPRRLHDQIWPFLGGFVDDVKGYLLRFLVEEGGASLPAVPRTSALGMYVSYGRSGEGATHP